MVAEPDATKYGLAAAAWTQNITTPQRLAKRLQSGTVWLNFQLASDALVAFGGHKQSGSGHKYGWKGIEGYLQRKTVLLEI